MTETPSTPPKTRKAADKSARTRSREFALQALYQHLVGGNAATDIDTFTRDLSGFHKADSVHYDALLHGCIEGAVELDALIAPLLDRPLAEVSPIEHGVLWIGVYEFRYRGPNRVDVYRRLDRDLDTARRLTGSLRP